MNFFRFLSDKLLIILMNICLIILTILLLNLLDAHVLLIISIPSFIIICLIISLLYEYFRKYKFYSSLKHTLENLDQKYYINEIIKNPSFYEGNIIKDVLYEINKSYIESLNKYKFSNEEFKEYIELWCHEIKTPIATSKLIINNNKNKITDDIFEEINKIESLVEQVLYYERSENVEKDYVITDTSLTDIINNIVKSNKKDLINKKIKIDMFKEEIIVKSDSKWLAYIINQILINSIKYSSKNPKITFDYKINKNNIILYIKDNGIGIKSDDLPKIYDKGFTGSNGRVINTSTGMGLYLINKLINKLGHSIKISSEENKYTLVTIIFPNESKLNDIK